MLELKAAADGSITGYASLFGGPADQQGDLVAPGAFEGAGLPHMLREHKGAPVGTWTDCTADEIGLRVQGVVTDPATLADLRAGKLDGLSIGFVTVKSHQDGLGRRVLEKVNLQEISIVKRPASSRARVLSVKSADAGKDKEMSEDTAEVEQEVESKSVDQVVADALAPLADRLAKLETKTNRPGMIATKSADDSKELETKAFGQYLRRGREGMAQNEVKSLNVSNDTSGGYTVVPQFLAELQRNLVLISPVRPLARVMSISGSEVLLPKRTSTLTAAWTTELADRSESAPAYGQNRYVAHEAAVYVDVSQQLLEDSALNIEAELARDLAEEFGRLESVAFVSGNGVGKPSGFMNGTDISSKNSGAANAVTCDGLIDLFHALAPQYRANGTWGMNSSTLATVRKLKNGEGDYLLQLAGVANAPVATILGRPIVEMPDMPDVSGNTYPIVFGDFNEGYRIFDRVNISIVRDPYTVASKGLVRFHARRRVAGGVAKSEALIKLKVAA